MRRGPQRSKRILVIEDDAWIRTFLRDALSDASYAVIEAADGRTGVRLASEERPDAVLLDLAMPGVTGVDVLRELRRRARTRRVPVLVLSAFHAVLPAADASSVSCVLTKPVEVTALLAAVEAALKDDQSVTS